MTLSEEFEKETGKDSEFQDLTYGTWGCSQDYVEWLEAKINYTRCCETFTCDVCFKPTENKKDDENYRYCNSCEKL
jgi:hypothetical protein